MTSIAITLRNRQSLQWWQWFKLLGAISLVILLIALALGVKVPSLAIGMILHLACDFTFQSSETAGRKGERGKHLIAHSLIAGGLVGILTGLSVSLWVGMEGLVIGAISHYLIDYSRKFENLVTNWKLGIALDQVCHICAIAVIASL
jgi:hypothetical protein